jgi:hypothetical protein
MPPLRLATLDAILAAHAAVLGDDLIPYGNHAHRVANLCIALRPGDAEQHEKVAVAAAFHDLGIWTHRTFDYLAPSADLAAGYLADTGKAGWVPEISAMILQHHKITAWRTSPDWLVEPFRRADWCDVSGGLIRSGLPRTLVRQLYAAWPGAGFHRLLVRLELAHLRRHPLNPLPVLRL